MGSKRSPVSHPQVGTRETSGICEATGGLPLVYGYLVDKKTIPQSYSH